MFGQVRLWKDCDRHCDFCYLNGVNVTTSLDEKKKRIMKLSRIIYMQMMDCTTIGIIGGELFPSTLNDELDTEWCCLADALRLSSASKIFIGTHLLGNVDKLIWFANMMKGWQDIQICTSYDTKGRFKNKEEVDTLLSNMEKVHNAGYKVVCSCTLTDELLHDDIQVPDYADFKIQALFTTEEWLRDVTNKGIDPKEYNDILTKSIPNLPNREDTLKWFIAHPRIATSYSQYSDKHASLFWDWDSDMNDYKMEEFVCNRTTECGHPYVARCYNGDTHCSMCDAKKTMEL